MTFGNKGLVQECFPNTCVWDGQELNKTDKHEEGKSDGLVVALAY